jgi:FkbH-like protein
VNPAPERRDAAGELAALREEIGGSELGSAQIDRVWRGVTECAELADLKVAWLGNHTLDLAVRHATATAFAHGVILANHTGAFDQHFQAVLDPASGLHGFAPDVIVLSLSLRVLAPDLVAGAAALPEEARRAEAGRVLDHVRQWVEAARSRTDATLLVCNFPRLPRAGLGLADLRAPAGDASLIGWLNENLCAAWRGDPQVHVLDVDHAIANAGRLATWNPQMYHLAKMEWSGAGLAAAGELIARALRALTRPAKKCLLLDLDNTLWGGIVGEDGVEGLRIGTGDPVGEAFLAFQRAILDVKARGVLLAIVSKNNREDVEEAFEKTRMPLRLEDFAAARINWEHKHDNIRSVAGELNIGLDSTVFVDDNPAECELIRQMLPEVEVMALPKDPAEYADLLLASWHFDKLELTEEDARKTEQYRDNAERSKSLQNATDLTSYLESLGTEVEIGRAGEQQLARLHQLFSKTNQFNLTTRRYSLAELKRFAEADDCLFEWVKVRDNFGDLGLVGTYLVHRNGEEAEIDSFILSCRAMGREVETAACNRIKEQVFGAGASTLRARFVPTSKNKPVLQFYDRQGFELQTTAPDGEKIYSMNAADGAPRDCTMLNITINEDP